MVKLKRERESPRNEWKLQAEKILTTLKKWKEDLQIVGCLLVCSIPQLLLAFGSAAQIPVSELRISRCNFLFLSFFNSLS